MTMLPRIKIDFLGGQLGKVGISPDGLVALVIGATAVAKTFELGKGYTITKLDDLKERGITAADNPSLYRHVTDFYRQAPEGTSLVICGVDPESKMQELFSQESEGVIRKLIEEQSGALRGIFVSTEAGDDDPVLEGISPDTLDTLAPAQELAEWATTTLYAPLFVVIDGRGYTGDNLRDLSSDKYNRVSILVGSNKAGDKGSCLGILAGRIANIPVQRHLGRVRDGALKPTAFFLGSKAIEEKQSDIKALNDKRYITVRRYVGRSGYFFAEDNLACKVTDDYAQIAPRRVIDKAYRIVYDTLLDNLLDEIELNADGTMQAPILKAWEQQVEQAINRSMTASGELSSDEGEGCECHIDPTQNVASTSKIELSVKVRPHGYARYIDVNLGFLVSSSKTE